MPHDTGDSDDDVGAPVDASIDAFLDPLADAALDAPSLPDTNLDAGTCRMTARWFAGPGDDTLSGGTYTTDGGTVLVGQFSTSGLVGDLTAGRFLARIEGDSVLWQQTGAFLDVERDADGLLVLREDGAVHLSPTGTMDRSLGAAVGAFGRGSIATRAGGAVVALTNSGSLTWSGTTVSSTLAPSDVVVIVLDPSGAVLASDVGGDGDNDATFDLAGAGNRFYVSGTANSRVLCVAPAGCSANDASFVLTLDGSPPRPLTFLGPDVVHATTGLAVDPSGNVYLAGAGATTSAAASGALRWSTGAMVSGVAVFDPVTDCVVIAGVLQRPIDFAGTTLMPLGAEQSLAVVWLDASTGALLRHEIFGDGTFGIADIDVTASGEVMVVGDTGDPFGVCGAAAPAGGGGADAFVLTFAPRGTS